MSSSGTRASTRLMRSRRPGAISWGHCHHSYATREAHFGKQVWLSRKGAIDAHVGMLGLIPCSIGDRSYVVRGKGHRSALCSSPHGAGRSFSRCAARRRFTPADLDERMSGIAWGHSDAFLDEHPQAYKPIDVVMHDARDLVEGGARAASDRERQRRLTYGRRHPGRTVPSRTVRPW